MGSTSIVALVLTSAASSLTPDNKQNEFSTSPKSGSLVASPFKSLHVLNAASPMNGWQQNHLRFYPSSSVAQPYLYPGQHGYTPPVPSDHASGHDTSRKASNLLDTRQWSPLPSLAAPYASGTPFMMGSRASPHVVPNGFTGSFASNNTLARGIAPGAQVIPHSQAIPDLSSGFPSSTGHHHTSPGTDASIPRSSPGYQCLLVHQPDPPAFSTNNVMPSYSSGSTEDITNFVNDERQAPVVISRSPEKIGSGRRRCQRACAFNIEGLWIDKDDLYTGAGQPGSGMISVHECHWAESSNPCGMWIIGSKSHVSVHICKWHSQRHAQNSADKYLCQWDGCTTSKAMLKDSINRHVVTVHFGEGFHCRGCEREFWRKDVYDKHVASNEVCGGAGVAIVYGGECRVIDTRQALQRGGDAVRCAGH